MNEFDKALDDYNECLRLDPDDSDAIQFRAVVLLCKQFNRKYDLINCNTFDPSTFQVCCEYLNDVGRSRRK